MTNEQVDAPSRSLNVVTKIIFIFLAGISIGVPLLEYLITGTLHPNGVGVMTLITVACSVTLGAFFALTFFGEQRYERIGTYGIIFCFITLISHIPMREYLTKTGSTPLMTLIYSALIGLLACLILAAVLALFRRLRPTQTN